MTRLFQFGSIINKRVWSIITELNGHVSSVKAVDADERFAVTASRDRTLKVWSLVELQNENMSDPSMKGKIIPTPKMTLRLAGSPSCVSLQYPHVVVGLKSAFFQNESVQQQ